MDANSAEAKGAKLWVCVSTDLWGPVSPGRGLSGLSEGVCFPQILQPQILACVVKCFTQESPDAGTEQSVEVWTRIHPYPAPNTHPRLHMPGAGASDTHSPNYFSVLGESSLSGSSFPCSVR